MSEQEKYFDMIVKGQYVKSLTNTHPTRTEGILPIDASIYDLRLALEATKKLPDNEEEFPLETLGRTFTCSKDIEQVWQELIEKATIVHSEILENAKEVVSVLRKVVQVSRQYYVQDDLGATAYMQLGILNNIVENHGLEHLRGDYTTKEIKAAWKIIELIDVSDLGMRVNEPSWKQFLHILRIRILGIRHSTASRKAIFYDIAINVEVEYRAFGLKARETQPRITKKGMGELERMCNDRVQGSEN